MSIGVIVLIVVGCVILLSIVIVIIVLSLHRRKPKIALTSVDGKMVIDNTLFKKVNIVQERIDESK